MILLQAMEKWVGPGNKASNFTITVFSLHFAFCLRSSSVARHSLHSGGPSDSEFCFSLPSVLSLCADCALLTMGMKQ